MVQNKFITTESRTLKFDKMVDRICEITDLDHKLIKKAGEKVLDEWEEKNHRELITLFTAKKSYRQEEIHRMAKTIQRYLEPMIDSRISIHKIEIIANYWLQDMFINF
jgi:hypothetical protein